MRLIVLKEFKKQINLRLYQCLRKLSQIKNKILPVKGVQQDEESYDDEAECLKGSITVSDNMYTIAMTNFQKSIY